MKNSLRENITWSFFTAVIIGATFALVVELVHMASYSVNRSYQDETLNFQTKACKQVQAHQAGSDNLKNLSDWKVSMVYIRCSLLSSPDVQIILNEFGEFIDTQKHSEIVNSSLASLIAIITLLFGGGAWFGAAWYNKTRSEITQQQNELKKHLSDLSGQSSFLKKTYAILFSQNEIVTNLMIDGRDESEAIKSALNHRISLDLFLTNSSEKYEKAWSELSMLYLSIGKDRSPEFSKLLALCQESHEETQKFLIPEMYFGEED